MNTLKRSHGGVIVRLLLLFVLPVAAGLWALSWYVANARYISTDNAYIKSNIIAISPSIGGRVTSVFVKDNQAVEAGDELFELDARAHQIALRRADAKLATIHNQIASMRATFSQIQAEIENAQERLSYNQRQFMRQQELGTQGMTTEAMIDEARYEVVRAKQTLRGLREKSQKQLAELGGSLDGADEDHPKYLEALAERGEAELALEYTQIFAPASGIISRMRLQAGEWVEAGDPVFSLVEQGSLWIEANLKETQLTDVKIGQHVEIEFDTYPDEVLSGTVASISAATGAEFLILPPQNATGNWVKVVQRVPVRIEMTESIDPDRAIRSGMTVNVVVDTGLERELFGIITDAVASMGSDD
jgi:membrane fusion protein (multidrug efflux system)